jgi:predicted nucleic acid-binding protein
MWYSDASFLVSAFGDDSRTSEALRWLANVQALPIIVSRLTLLEFDTAMKASVQGGKLSSKDAQSAHLRLQRALSDGYLKRAEVLTHQWFPQAQRITAHATTAAVCRALDVLHVTAALLLKQSGFLSFDGPQRELAKAEGLQVEP